MASLWGEISIWRVRPIPAGAESSVRTSGNLPYHDAEALARWNGFFTAGDMR